VLEDIFRTRAHYLRHKRRRSACFICANVPKRLRSSRFVPTIVFETNISIFKLLPNSFQFSEYLEALAQVSIELITIYFHSFDIFNIQIGKITFCKPDLLLSSQIIFRMLKKANAFWMILKHYSA
jgi:hypothetical protein